MALKPSRRRCSVSPPSKNPLCHSQFPPPSSTRRAATSPTTVLVTVRTSQVLGSRKPAAILVAKAMKASSKGGPNVIILPPLTPHLSHPSPEKFPCPERLSRSEEHTSELQSRQ